MPQASNPLSPETGARARQLYAEGIPVARILGETGLSLGSLYYWLDGGGGEGDPRLPPVPRRRIVLGKRRKALKGSRVSLVARLWRTAERQVRDIEARLALAQQEPADRERDARVMAVLVKTLRELTQFDERANETAQDDDDGPRDIDEFRRDLARRMEEFVRERSAERVPGAGGTGED